MFKSKAILTALVDAVAGVIILVINRFWPEWSEFTISLWGVMQPLALALIAHYAVEPVRACLLKR
jgi:hypothetical protein